MKAEGAVALPWFAVPLSAGTATGSASMPFAPFLPELSARLSARQVGAPVVDGSTMEARVGAASEQAPASGEGALALSLLALQGAMPLVSSLMPSRPEGTSSGAEASAETSVKELGTTAEALTGGASIAAALASGGDIPGSQLLVAAQRETLLSDTRWLRQETSPLPPGALAGGRLVGGQGSRSGVAGLVAPKAELAVDRVTLRSSAGQAGTARSAGLPREGWMLDSARLAQGIRAEVIPEALRELASMVPASADEGRRDGRDSPTSDFGARQEVRVAEDAVARSAAVGKAASGGRPPSSDAQAGKGRSDTGSHAKGGAGGAVASEAARRPSQVATTVSTAASDAANAVQTHAPHSVHGGVRPQAEADPVLSHVLAEQEPAVVTPQELPQDRVIRVDVDGDLSVEVSTHAGEVDVVLDGTPEAVRPLADMGRELEGSLSGSGFSLNEFSMRERDGQPTRERNAAGVREESSKPAASTSRVRRGAHVNRLA